MAEAERDIVTGAFSFTGKYIARRLLALGRRVVTLTGRSQGLVPGSDAIPAFPLRFDDSDALARLLTGASTLYNTYWIRFERGETTFARALRNTEILLQAAKAAGVRRVIHFSAVHADESSPFPFFRAKGAVERLLRESGLSYAIVRPTILFGVESVFLNNIAWMLRHFPVFAIPGKDGGRLQPVYVDDVAAIAVRAGQDTDNRVIEAAGPEVLTFEAMVRLLAKETGSHARLLHFRPERTLQLSRLIGERVGDVVLTKDEIDGLLNGLLLAAGPAAGKTAFSDWLPRHAAAMGKSYVSEVERHYTGCDRVDNRIAGRG